MLLDLFDFFIRIAFGFACALIKRRHRIRCHEIGSQPLQGSLRRGAMPS